MELNLNLNIDKDKIFYKTIAAITIPIALQNIISYGVNLMDTVMLGKLGEVALSATSLANQVFFMFTLLIFGIGGGAVVLCSQYWGSKNILSIQKITTIILKISFAVRFSIVFRMVSLVSVANAFFVIRTIPFAEAYCSKQPFFPQPQTSVSCLSTTT